MKRLAMVGLLVALALLPVVPAVADFVCTLDATGAHTLKIINLCDGFVMWKTGPQDFMLVCPGTTPPAGAIELREFYNFPVWHNEKQGN